jgi:hypothetical protein
MEIKTLRYNDLTDEEKEDVPNSGSGKKYAYYIKITHEGKTLCLESDAMEPEDAIFLRDLSWIPGMLQKCYEIGKNEE